MTGFQNFTEGLTPRLVLGFFTGPQGDVHVYKYDGVPLPNGMYTLGPAQAGTLQDVEALRALTEPRGGGVLLHEHVLMHTATQSVWWVPAESRPLFFAAKVEGVRSIETLNGKSFPQPPLLMIRRGRVLYVYALKENHRPTAQTPVFVAPYWNMFSKGQMCMGSVTLPATFNPSDPHDHTQHFFQSRFNGANLLNWGGGLTHQELWERALERGSFDLDCLLVDSTLKTVADVLAAAK